MKRLLSGVLATLVWIGIAGGARSQDTGSERITVPLSDPSRPGTVKVNLINGSITVKGSAGKEVIVETKIRDEEKPRERSRPETAGMKRIPNFSSGLNVEEENNVVTINTGGMSRTVDITLQVPTNTALNLKTVSDGDIKVDQVRGDIEVNDINGAVTLAQVSGSVVAHALNGDVKVSLTAVDPNKPMSFSSLNGDIDVSFPADLKANVSMKSDQGEIFSDFDVRLDPTASKPVVEGSPGKGGKYKIKVDRVMHGSINGGGPEIQFKTFNGNIYIRKATK